MPVKCNKIRKDYNQINKLMNHDTCAHNIYRNANKTVYKVSVKGNVSR